MNERSIIFKQFPDNRQANNPCFLFLIQGRQEIRYNIRGRERVFNNGQFVDVLSVSAYIQRYTVCDL